jgi:hypothetical protein
MAPEEVPKLVKELYRNQHLAQRDKLQELVSAAEVVVGSKEQFDPV